VTLADVVRKFRFDFQLGTAIAAEIHESLGEKYEGTVDDGMRYAYRQAADVLEADPDFRLRERLESARAIIRTLSKNWEGPEEHRAFAEKFYAWFDRKIGAVLDPPVDIPERDDTYHPGSEAFP
jgi:hypothetical protein